MENSIWIFSTEMFLAESLLKHVREGNLTESSFKKTVWPAIVAELNAKYAAELSKPITALQAKDKEVIVSLLIQVNTKYLEVM